MRLPNGLVNHSRERLERVLAGTRARLQRGAAGDRAGVARVLQERLARLLVKHGADRLARSLVVALVLLMGGGTAAAVALLPSDAVGTPAAAGGSSPAKQSHRFAVGELVAQADAPRRAGPSYYRKTAARRVSASTASGFMALYREAARTFGVSWRLLASIHRQETAFSTAPTTYHGLNPFGCCAGPMQFNVTNGPPSTWALYRLSYRLGDRPRRYPHPTLKHPSIYDDFDAMMAAGALLRDSGATEALDGGAWSAAYAYYGHDLYGIDYASEVLARARGWERDGFCVNCPVDGSLVAAFDDAYGVDARRVLLADERRAKQEKKKREKRKKEARAKARKKAEKAAAERRKSRRSSPREPARRAPQEKQTPTTPEPSPSTTTTTPTTTTETPPPPPPPPPASDCSGLKKLLGCG